MRYLARQSGLVNIVLGRTNLNEHPRKFFSLHSLMELGEIVQGSKQNDNRHDDSAIFGGELVYHNFLHHIFSVQNGSKFVLQVKINKG